MQTLEYLEDLHVKCRDSGRAIGVAIGREWAGAADPDSLTALSTTPREHLKWEHFLAAIGCENPMEVLEIICGDENMPASAIDGFIDGALAVHREKQSQLAG